MVLRRTWRQIEWYRMSRSPLGQKAPNLVSPKARANARGKECTLRLGCCNHDPATTVLAHIRMFSMAGLGQKPPDFAAVFACSACHDAIDGRSNAAQFGTDDILIAVFRTLTQQFADGIFK